MTFADRLKKIIKTEYDGVAHKFALAAGLRASTLHNYIERGSLPGVEIIIKLAQAGHVSIDWLLTGEEPSIGRLAMHETTAPYCESETPDEKKYCALLRRILRSKNKKRADIIKASIEEFSESEDRDFLKKVHQKKKAANDK